MITTGYLAKTDTYPKTDILLAVTRYKPRYHPEPEWKPTLAPSPALLWDYKKGRIDWETYEKRYREEMTAPDPRNLILFYANRVRSGQVFRLLCIERDPPCHRFILQDIIQEASK